jgi:NAD(P)-dependent dehydrogenase (short-subunit alcohol dehydrogenase family)
MSELNGQTAWVAGGGRGIGRAICGRLAALGATVVTGSRTESEIAAVAAAIVAQGGKAHAAALDVADRASVRRFVAQAEALAGPPTILVFCSGVNTRLPADEYPDDAWARVLDINLTGAFRFLQESGRRMLAAGKGGSVVTIASLQAHIATPNQSAYCAAKSGLLGYTRLLAVEWAKHGIRVNSVSPGFIETPLTAPAMKQASFRDNALAKTPLARFGQPAEIADAVCYLAGPRASFVTGTDLAVDGGFLTGMPGIVARTA